MNRTAVRAPRQPHPWPVLTVSEHGALLEDERLIMPSAEARMLWALARANGRIITWVELHHALWPAEFFIAPQPLYSHLSRLRAQLAIALAKHRPDADLPIRTIPKVGVELRWPPDRLLLHHIEITSNTMTPPPPPDRAGA